MVPALFLTAGVRSPWLGLIWVIRIDWSVWRTLRQAGSNGDLGVLGDSAVQIPRPNTALPIAYFRCPVESRI